MRGPRSPPPRHTDGDNGTPPGPSYTTKQLVVDLAQLHKTNVVDRVGILLDDDHVASLRTKRPPTPDTLTTSTRAHATVVAWAGGVCARRLVTTFVQRRMVLSVDEVLGLADPDLADMPFRSVGDGATLEDLKRHTMKTLERCTPFAVASSTSSASPP